MRRLLPLALVAFVVAVLITGNASATTYYIAANGSDSNNGTSQTTPWQHAPGMPKCTGVCASKTPQPGDKFIFRGGDTWHFSNSSATVYIGGSWNWSWAGTSTNCNFDASVGAVVRTSCIYLGVDQTWYSGASWVRPIVTMDNPLSTSFVSSCAYLDDSFNGWNITGGGYVQIDNFDYQGNCSGSSPSASFTGTGASGPVEWSNNYFHGWTVATGGNYGGYVEVGCGGGGCSGFVLFDHNVMDGSDSTGASTAYTGTEKGMGICTDVEFNVIRYVSNFCVDGSQGSSGSHAHIYHDNLFEYLYNPNGGHGNVIEMVSGVSPGNSSGPVYFYNNITRHIGEGVTYDLIPNSGGYVYIVNNVFYDIGNGANCLGPNGNGAASAITAYIYNNTFDYQVNAQGGTNGGCKVAAGAPVTVNFQNNHFINYPSNSISAVWNGTGTGNDNGNEVWQSESAANAEGYAESNGYAPPAACSSSACGTVGAANNNHSLVSVFTPTSMAYGSGTSAGVVEIGYGGGYGVSFPATTMNPRQSTAGSCTQGTPGCWDAGAYQFASSSASQPNAPTGLTAVVQ
jgi:hypothetical protein